MKTSSQRGFSVVEGLLLAIIVGAIGFVGWYVYTARNTASKNQATPVVQKDEKEPDCTTLKTDNVIKTKYFCFIAPNEFWQNEYSERSVISKMAPSDQFNFARANRGGDGFFDAKKQRWYRYDFDDPTKRVYLGIDEGDLQAIHEVNGVKFYEFAGNGVMYCRYNILLFEHEGMMTQVHLPESCDPAIRDDPDAPKTEGRYITEDFDEDLKSALDSFRFL